MAKQPELIIRIPRYPPFLIRYLWSSLIFGIAGGFGIAAHLSWILGFGYQIRSSFTLMIQNHAQLQLVGWTGSLLIGISLCLMQRIASKPFASISRQAAIWWLITSGLSVRVFSFMMLPYLDSIRLALHISSLLGAMLISFGILLYVLTVIKGMYRNIFAVRSGQSLAVAPYFALMLFGWMVFALYSLILAWIAFKNKSGAVGILDHSILTDCFTMFILLPAGMGFSIKMLPVFMGLREPSWAVRKIGLFYAISAIMMITSTVISFYFPGPLSGLAKGFSTFCCGIVLLVFIWELDALLHRILPERIALKLARGGENAKRGRYGDYGEYGHFEYFIYASFIWLLLSALALVLNGIALVSGKPEIIQIVLIRHTLLLGFIANLIVGVGFRLLPKLIEKPLRNPKLVNLAFVFLVTASIARILPFVIPSLGIAGRYFFGFSGVLGMMALIIFAYNLNLFYRPAPAVR